MGKYVTVTANPDQPFVAAISGILETIVEGWLEKLLPSMKEMMATAAVAQILHETDPTEAERLMVNAKKELEDCFMKVQEENRKTFGEIDGSR